MTSTLDQSHPQPATTTLSLKSSLPITISSSAPAYSVVVTAPFIIAAVGYWAVAVYVLAAIPMWLVSRAMADNDARHRNKGTVYTWVDNHLLSWLSGYALAITGTISTSGLAFVAATLILDLLGVDSTLMAVIATGALLAAGVIINITSLALTSIIQTLGIISHLVCLIVLVLALIKADLSLGPVIETVTHTPGAWVYAILIAVFAYWGFDTAFALTEESEPDVPGKASSLSILTLTAFYAAVAATMVLVGTEIITANPAFAVIVIISCVMSLGSTMLPTVRGIQEMSQQRDLPAWLHTTDKAAETAVFLVAWAWCIWALVDEGVFNDTIESLSVLVGFYFTLATYAAWTKTRSSLHLITTIVMAVITLGTLAQMILIDDYGDTTLGGLNGVLVIVAALSALGVIGYLAAARKTPIAAARSVNGNIGDTDPSPEASTTAPTTALTTDKEITP